MDQNKNYKIELTMIIFSLVIYGIGVFFTKNLVAWSVGIAIGLIVAILKLHLIENTLKKAVCMPQDKAKGYIQKHYFLRYILTGLLLLIVTFNPNISLLGTFIGLTSMKIGVYAQLLKK